MQIIKNRLYRAQSKFFHNASPNNNLLDHQKLAKRLKLYTTSKLSPGSIFFLPHGTRIILKLQDYLRRKYFSYEYQEVITPIIYDKRIWAQSGHWENYYEDMYLIKQGGRKLDGENIADGSENGLYGLKPMNCPGHCLMFASSSHSWRELPIRYADFSPLHRNEASGALCGLIRANAFHQDDAHIFCRKTQIQEEISKTIKLLDEVYQDLGIHAYELQLSTRPEEKFVGSISEWNEVESLLLLALQISGKPWSTKIGEGAFYGPKIDIVVKDFNGKDRQMATVQLDVQLPQNFQLHFRNEKGVKEMPVIIHRAILGSIERFLAITLEKNQGNWPFWLNPRQAIILMTNTAPEIFAYSNTIKDLICDGSRLTNNFWSDTFYVDIDCSSRTLSKKYFFARELAYNYIITIGNNELERNVLSVRTREGKNFECDPKTLRAIFEDRVASLT